MGEAKAGDTVEVHYTGRLSDGTVFDSSEDGGPLRFTLGEGELIPGFEEAVLGMEPGESLTATLAPEDAYGEHREDLIFQVPQGELPEELDPERGDRLEVKDNQGRTFEVTVAEVGDGSVTLDANHPLAGRELIFDIELVEIA